MTFLPIVERELRVAARKRSTVWVRIAAACVALLIGGAFMLLAMVGSFGAGSASFGKGLFATLTWLSVSAALTAGLFFTSDCLSEEKREGTIGLLFLTDLRGYDVVLGKLLSTSLRGFYALLAIFPMLAVTLLMGGVTGAQFWKTALALVNALFFSLAAGVLVSAISRESQKALAATLLLLLVAVAGGPALDAMLDELAANTSSSPSPVFSLSSPGYLFVVAGDWGRTPFWRALLVNQACAWLLLGLSCALLPRHWRETAAKTSTERKGWAHSSKYGRPKRREARRRKLAAANPVLWLACRERWQASLVWAIAILMAGGVAALLPGGHQSGRWFGWNFVVSALMMALYLGVASQAGRFFLEAQRTGLLELLLATPLPLKKIVQGQWGGLLRMFGPPLAMCLLVNFISTMAVQQMTRRAMTGAAAATLATLPSTNASQGGATVTTVVVSPVAGNVTSTGATAGFSGGDVTALLVTVAVCAAGTLALAGNLAAISWFGMWMGLNSKSNSIATLKTIAFVQVVPWFAVSFFSALAFPLLMWSGVFNKASGFGPGMMLWYPLLTVGISASLSLAKDVGFLVWSRRKLYSDFRERMVPGVAPRVRSALPPPLPPVVIPIGRG